MLILLTEGKEDWLSWLWHTIFGWDVILGIVLGVILGTIVYILSQRRPEKKRERLEKEDEKNGYAGGRMIKGLTISFFLIIIIEEIIRLFHGPLNEFWTTVFSIVSAVIAGQFIYEASQIIQKKKNEKSAKSRKLNK